MLQISYLSNLVDDDTYVSSSFETRVQFVRTTA